MWLSIWEFITEQWGSIASASGLIIVVLTFFKARSAAKSAEGARRGVTQTFTLADLSAVLEVFDELKRLIRVEAHPHALVERCSHLRRLLQAVRTRKRDFSDNQKKVLQGAHGQVAQLESVVEQAIREGKSSVTYGIDAAKALSRQIDKLATTLEEVKLEQPKKG